MSCTVALRIGPGAHPNIDDLEYSSPVLFHRMTLSLRPPGHPLRSYSLDSLGTALYFRFKEFGDMEDLEDMISSYREALTLHPPDHPNHAGSLNNLAAALNARFEHVGTMEDLEVAISLHHEALTFRPPGHPDRSSSLSNLGAVLRTRFEQLGRIEDLEGAISSHQEALTFYYPGHPGRPHSLINLANALHTRFDQSGKMEDLENSISFQREALTLCPRGHLNRPSSLNGLAVALGARFELLGRMEDLEVIISCHCEVLTLLPRGHPDYPNSLGNLASALNTRFQQLGRMEDLEGAISAHREVLTLHPPSHPGRSNTLNNLASALGTRFNQSSRIEDLEEGILFNQEVLTLRPPGHPLRPSSLTNLAIALISRHLHLGRIEDLEDAIASFREALTLRPLGHSSRSISLNYLATALNSRYIQLGETDDLDESFALFEQAANDLASSSLHRLTAAIRWASMARDHNHNSVMRAYSISLHLLNRCLILHPNVDSQQKFLATARVPKSLASDAASAAIDAGELEAAVEFLEEGRAILWSRMEGYRHPLDQLRQVDGQLADRLEAVNTELERLELSSGSGPLASGAPMAPAALEAQMTRHRKLSEEWEGIVGKVREIEGFANFLQAVPFSTLRMAATEGPIVLINISEYRSDALILHANNLRPILVPLPNAHPENLTQLAAQLVLARSRSGDNPSKYFLPVLRGLWADIISPLHDCLTELGVPEKSRVWWCPTSELCALPLHAAGQYQSKQKNLPDIYISSYIPTISALIRSRSNAALGRAVAPKLLVIGQAETLPKVQDEIDHIRQLDTSVDIMVGEEASHDRVLDSLQHHSWAHFACHGHLGDDGQPFHASFELHGGSRLTLLDLIQARLPNAELAFLSACHSAAGDLITPHETIHLAAALQFCGFRSVVGTLWAMADEDGPTVSKEFYKHMFRKPGNGADFRDSAEALNLAIREMRKNGVPLHRWIMFVHIGA